MATLPETQSGILPAGKFKVPAPPKPEAREPISVNGVIISVEAIRAEVQHHPADTPAKAFDEAARALVVRELLLQEIAADGITAMPEALREGCTETDEEAAIRSLLETHIKTPVADDAACRRYYDANPGRLRAETIYEARHILFAAHPSDEAARVRAKAEAEAVIATLSADPSRFADLAQAHSACSSSETGGNLGQLTKGSTVPEFETFLFALEEGQLSPVPVSTPFGYHVLQLDRIIPGRQLPFEMVRERVAAWLEASSWSRAISQYIGILAVNADISGIDWESSP